MTPEDFTSLAGEGYNRIPLTREILADLDTPLSTYLKLADGPYSYLLESVHGGEKWGRYSIIGLPSRTVLRVRGQQVEVIQDGRVAESAKVEDPLAWIESYQQRFKVAEPPGLPRFSGGLVAISFCAASRQPSASVIVSTRPSLRPLLTLIGLPVSISCMAGRTPAIWTARTVPPKP